MDVLLVPFPFNSAWLPVITTKADVFPAQAGIHGEIRLKATPRMDPRLRGEDKKEDILYYLTRTETVLEVKE